MATSEQPPKKKKPQRSSDDINLLKSEVASFASSLGLAPSIPGGGGGGFDDSDFRKSGPLKPPRTPKSLIPSNSSDFDASKSKDNKPPPDLKSKAKPHPLQIDPFPSSQKPSSKEKDKLPLMKASSLSGQWYTDAEELESKVLGSEGRKPPTLGMETMKGLAERKKEVAERLMEQYSLDYESSRRKSGDMRLLETTARSGTSADKVSAFTCLVEDNPIANVRSLDALLGLIKNQRNCACKVESSSGGGAGGEEEEGGGAAVEEGCAAREIANAEKDKVEKLIKDMERKCDEKIAENKEEAQQFLMRVKEEHGAMMTEAPASLWLLQRLLLKMYVMTSFLCSGLWCPRSAR